MPVIGITPSRKLPDYEEAVRRAGGEPRVLDIAGDRPADVVATVDGLLLTGGADIDPSLYGAAAHPSTQPDAPGRDAFEIELVRRALDADLPVFAICRGAQVLNVAAGGTLIQDIRSELPSATEHQLAVPPHQPVEIAHDVWVTRGSLLERLMAERLAGGEDLPVNSRHHQAPARTGEGLVVTATSPDGVIEALEHPGKRFCLGVQWHPENFWRTGEFSALFEGFVAATKTRRRD
ncbi:MAG: gamma-glutamyl-gamma-aminobutyrate hydrolase family protein [Vicinamibacterales bacterium]